MTAWIDHSALPCPAASPEHYDGVVAKRALAWVVDAALIAAMTLVAVLLTLGVGLIFLPAVALVVGGLYRVATLSGGSATWGMRLMGIELRGPDGHRLSGGQSVLHVAGYYASVTFALLPAVASAVAMLATERRQGLTDLVLGTAAINRPG